MKMQDENQNTGISENINTTPLNIPSNQNSEEQGPYEEENKSDFLKEGEAGDIQQQTKTDVNKETLKNDLIFKAGLIFLAVSILASLVFFVLLAW